MNDQLMNNQQVNNQGINHRINKDALNSANFAIISSDFMQQLQHQNNDSFNNQNNSNQHVQFEFNSTIEQLDSLIKARDNFSAICSKYTTGLHNQWRIHMRIL